MMKATSIVPLLLLWTSLSANAFHSTNVIRPVLSRHENAVSSPSVSAGHLLRDNKNPFPCRSWEQQAVSSTRTGLKAFQLKSFFRSSTDSTATPTALSTDVATTAVPQRTKRAMQVAESSVRSLASLRVTSRATQKLKTAAESFSFINWSEALDQILLFIRSYYWVLPSFLALVPLYTTYVLGIGDAAMPHWWPVTKMEHILKSPDAAVVIGSFLFSNIAYFICGGYLIKQFPFVRPETTSSMALTQTISSADVATAGLGASVSASLSTIVESTKNTLSSLRIVPTRQTWLGLLLLSAGLISTMFHTEQALGSYALSNSLCYLDHAVAGTATFYYFHLCGRPSKRVWALGIAGLVALSVPLPGYAWLHSAWHYLSAGAATLWAVEAFGCTERSSVAMVKPIAVVNETEEDEKPTAD